MIIKEMALITYPKGVIEVPNPKGIRERDVAQTKYEKVEYNKGGETRRRKENSKLSRIVIMKPM